MHRNHQSNPHGKTASGACTYTLAASSKAASSLAALAASASQEEQWPGSCIGMRPAAPGTAAHRRPLHDSARAAKLPEDERSCRVCCRVRAHQRAAHDAVVHGGAHGDLAGQHRAHLRGGRLEARVHQHEPELARERQPLQVQRLAAPARHPCVRVGTVGSCRRSAQMARPPGSPRSHARTCALRKPAAERSVAQRSLRRARRTTLRARPRRAGPAVPAEGGRGGAARRA